MFTAEQEQQLSAWGCPDVYPPPLDPAPRQPHDVLAWLGGFSWALVVGDDIITGKRFWYCCAHGAGIRTSTYPDPHSAAYALAEAVMRT